MMHYYYTIYRKDYLYKGLILYESMKQHDIDFKFFVVCMEDESVELLRKMNYINLVPINIREIEEFDKRIPELKGQRGEKTYIWTAKASVPLYLFKRFVEVDHVIWLDGDTEFLSSPQPIYEQWGDNSVLLTKEMFDGDYEYLGHMFGFYNTGFMGFKKDKTGISVLEYFRERLQEWKNTEEEQVNWNDQLYVNDWTERFQKVGVVEHRGINLTPFIASRINEEEKGFVHLRGNIPYIKDMPIVLYHFMAFKYYDGNEFDLCSYWMKFDTRTITKLYVPYFRKCNEAFERIKYVEPDFYPPLNIKGKYIGNYFNNQVNSSESKYNICTITDSKDLVKVLALYESIKKHSIKFRLWICCEDAVAYNKLKALNLSEIQLLDPYNLIKDYNMKAEQGVTASRAVLKARLFNLIMLNNHNVENLLYVDCCCYFHQDPSLIMNMQKNCSILLIHEKLHGNDARISSSVIGLTRDQYLSSNLFYWVEESKKWLGSLQNIQDELEYISKWEKGLSKVNILRKPSYLLNDNMLRTVKLRKLNDGFLVDNEEMVIYKYELPDAGANISNDFIEQLLKSATPSKRHIYLPYLKSIKSGLDMLRKVSHINT